MQLVMTGGANTGQIRTIASNTASTITVFPGFPVAIANGDGFQIIDSAHPAQEVYRISVSDPYGIADFTYIPTTDTTGRIRAVKTSNNDGTGSMMFYNASGALLRKLDLPAPVTTTLVAVYQLASKAENPGTTIKATMDNFRITSPATVNPNPYSNEAQVRTTSDGTPTGTTLLPNSTPAFVSGVDDKSNCTCTEQPNGKVTCQ
jgi:hypothetical protein